MKATALLTLLLLFTTFSYTQSTNITGEWFAPDSEVSTPVGFVFSPNGELQVLEIGNESDEVYQIIQGHYYYEDGSNLLVTITWYNDAAKTTKYTFSFDDSGQLVMEQFYPEKIKVNYVREGNLVTN